MSECATSGCEASRLTDGLFCLKCQRDVDGYDLIRLSAMVPESLQEALKTLSVADAVGAARAFLEANEEDRAGMLAFIDEDGPRRVRELRVRDEDGTPTAADLEDWL